VAQSKLQFSCVKNLHRFKIYRAGYCSGNAMYLYMGDTCIESQPGYPQSRGCFSILPAVCNHRLLPKPYLPQLIIPHIQLNDNWTITYHYLILRLFNDVSPTKHSEAKVASSHSTYKNFAVKTLSMNRGSLPCSHEPVTGPYPEPDNAYVLNTFKIGITFI
jgi:hypothetical protein